MGTLQYGTYTFAAGYYYTQFYIYNVHTKLSAHTSKENRLREKRSSTSCTINIRVGTCSNTYLYVLRYGHDERVESSKKCK